MEDNIKTASSAKKALVYVSNISHIKARKSMRTTIHFLATIKYCERLWSIPNRHTQKRDLRDWAAPKNVNWNKLWTALFSQCVIRAKSMLAFIWSDFMILFLYFQLTSSTCESKRVILNFFSSLLYPSAVDYFFHERAEEKKIIDIVNHGKNEQGCEWWNISWSVYGALSWCVTERSEK